MITAFALLLAAKTLDVVFVPDAPDAPDLVVVVDDDDDKRTMAWAFSGGPAGVLSDEGPRPSLLRLPAAPKGGTLLDEQGVLTVIVDDAGAWQDALAKLPRPKATPALPIPGPTSLRLAVTLLDPGPSPAVLYGASVAVPGRAVVHARKEPVRAVVVAGKDLVEAPATAVDLVSACGRDVPSAVSVVSAVGVVGAPVLKLLANGSAVCAGPVAVVPVAGARLDAKKDVPAAGVVVAR